MKYVIDVSDDKVEAFMKVMEGLRQGAVVQSVQMQKDEPVPKLEKSASDRRGSGEKTAYDFVEQYRDLVD